MKMKNLLLTIAATFGMTALTMAQNVPNYVPINGLVGWWPFNGNANDESGNGNNGIVNGATLTTDRFGNLDNAYDFDGVDDWIQVIDTPSLRLQNATINCWVQYTSMDKMALIYKQNINDASNSNYGIEINDYAQILGPGPRIMGMYDVGCGFTPTWTTFTPGTDLSGSSWHQITAVFDIGIMKIYFDGILAGTIITPINIMNACAGSDLLIGRGWQAFPLWYAGLVDDLAIWNRVLTQQEIAELYNATNCSNNTSITPQTNTINTGAVATFTASTSDPNPSYEWQSDFGQGFQTLNNIGNYTGTNTGTLNIADIQLPNHTQPIRVITISGNCIDTSNVAIISIADTCINTITDTILITVTDTLLINTTITGLNPPNNANTIKVFPNPTNDHITIDYGNFSVMNGYQLKIENSLGQQVFQTNITQQSDYLNLTTWGGNGLYFVHIIDPQGNTIDIKKIVLH
jgi:hypothetical protein